MGFLDRLVASLPDILIAVLFLILAFVLATIVKKLLVKLLSTDGVKSKLAKVDKENGGSHLIDMIGKLAFLLVFLLFLPAVLNRLNMTGVSEPITNFVSSIIQYIPLLFAAGVIVYVGIFVADLIKDIVTSLLATVGVDKFQAKYAPVKDENARLSNILGMILYVLILIPVITAALDILGLQSISQPFTALLNDIISYIPKIFVAGLLLFVGVFISKIVVNLLRSILEGANIDRVGAELGLSTKFSFAKIISEAVRYVLIIFFLVEAVKVLDLIALTTIASTILAYVPIALSAGLIVLAAVVLAKLAERFILSNNGSRTISSIVKVAIYAVAGFMTLSQLGIGSTIVEAAFVIILAAIGIAFAIAFGLGGKDFAKRKLNDLDSKAKEELNNDSL